MSSPWDNFVPPQAVHKGAPGWMRDVTGFLASVNRGLGVGDEVAAAGNTAANLIRGKIRLADIPADLAASMAMQRQAEDGFTAQHPLVAAAARGTGNALLAAAPIGPGAEAFAGGGVATNALRGATTAGLTGAAYGAVDRGTLAQRAHAAAAAAADPLTLALGAVGGAAATTKVPSVAPSYDQLVTAKKAAYKAMDDAGVSVAPGAFSDLAGNMADSMDAEGFNAGLHPKAANLLDKIGQSSAASGGDYSPTLTQLDQLRRQIGRDVASSNDPGERRMGTIMRGSIDNFLNQAGPEDLVGADPQTAIDMLNTGRALNTRLAKLDTLDNLDEAASDRASVTGSGGNGQNALRQNIVRFKNSVGNLTPDELAATQTAIDGTPAQNALRMVGKLSPEGNGLVALANASSLPAEVLTGHSPVAVAQAGTAVAGAIAKRASDAIAQRNVQALRDLIASGGDAASAVSQQLSDPAYADLRAQVANDLSVQAGAQGRDLGDQSAPAQSATPTAPVDPWANYVPPTATATSPQ